MMSLKNPKSRKGQNFEEELNTVENVTDFKYSFLHSR